MSIKLLARLRRTKSADPSSDAAKSPVCELCCAPATEVLQHVPWPGTTYAPATYSCDEHADRLLRWPQDREGAVCATCRAPYGECHHTVYLARQFREWATMSERHRLSA